MKLVINTSTLSGTGVTQVAVSFINECIQHPSNEYHVLLSPTVAFQINQDSFPSNFLFYIIKSHPLYGIKGFFIRRKLKRKIITIGADCVFSVFGPSCWTPTTPHLQGYANPYHVYPESPQFQVMSLKERFYIFLHKMFYKYFLKRNGKYFVCETEDVSNRLASYLNIPRCNVFTVSNTYSSIYNNAIIDDIKMLPPKAENEFRFLSLCSFQKHKNIEILNEVIPILKTNAKRKIRFVLTVDAKLFEELISPSVKDSIINLGRVNIVDCPYLYNECDAIFLPTLLECFSANYPEAMVMKKPILTSNLSFATTVCDDAALYFDPINANDIVSKILEITNDDFLYQNLINNGIKRLSSFDSSITRAEKYLKICERIANY